MGKSIEELAGHLAALSMLAEKLDRMGPPSEKSMEKMAQLVAWIIDKKFKGKLHLTPEEMKEMQRMNHIAIVGVGNDKDGLTFVSKPMGEDDDDDDTCECGRCKDCGEKHK